MISRTEPASGEDGFSILEMIVAVTILALVLGIASQSIVMASRSIAAAKAQVEAVRAVRTMLADYDANTESSAVGSEHLTQSGWSLKTRKIEVSRAKITAIVIERTGVAGAARGGTFLTFVPEQDLGSE
ncbi:MAG: prepilin-type N-terminal cleavage/methylation domain-containing protein [Mesorhizobium sp.]|uniref:PulJ/GspJ family protein n=1 Tax=Mesorhizobium sp. TaxID=1871066 RepID=UPI00121FB437|nr:prepilin-type N-terminal cleavage/methylation domain-containing protein [Mesorhizobium sp.]TIQ16775.1 MAG: prepilin-type N-terminal cleavage/methylation domain-containing protein [Mesorhizobium sp.]